MIEQAHRTKRNYKEELEEFFKYLKFNFKVIHLSDIWWESVDRTKNSNNKVKGYLFIKLGMSTKEEASVFYVNLTLT